MGSQDDAIQAIETVSGFISIISCLAMSKKIWRERTSSVTSGMLAFLFLIDFVLAIFYTIGRSAIANYGMCQFQALMIQWFSVCAFLWVVLMCYLMHEWIVRKKHPKRLAKVIKRFQIAIFIFAAVLAFILLGVGAYDDADVWCWIGDDYPQARLWTFEIILMFAWVVNLLMIQRVFSSIHSRMHQSSVQLRIGNLLNSTITIQRKLILYAVVFTCLWFFPLLNRLLEYGYGNRVFVTSFLSALFLPLQGFVNALCYGDFLDIRKLLKVADLGIVFFTSHLHLGGGNGHGQQGNEKNPHEIQEILVEATPETMALPAKAQTTYVPKKYSIFTSTLNLGEAPLQSLITEVKDWIVEGHDVYAIGMQECIDLTGIRELMLNHLGGESKYVMYTSSIGSDNTRLGYHGYIALTVFVKKSEVEQGYIHATTPTSETMATGTDLIITTAQNKGAVGIPLQIHDTSIGFVTCHLPSDSKGKSKLTKRNASAHAILKEVILAPEDLGFDLHLQHDHILVFGDLNYRMETEGVGSGVNSLTGVSVACSLEKEMLNQDPLWLSRKYNLLRHLSDPLHPSIEEVKLLHAAKTQSRGAWKSVLRADELRAIMDDGDAFYCFEEPMPCFPPSYKRKKGKIEGDCGDYSDFAKIISGYSNLGHIENELLPPPPRTSSTPDASPSILPKQIKKKQKKLQEQINKTLKLPGMHSEQDIVHFPDAENMHHQNNKDRSNSTPPPPAASPSPRRKGTQTSRTSNSSSGNGRSVSRDTLSEVVRESGGEGSGEGVVEAEGGGGGGGGEEYEEGEEDDDSERETISDDPNTPHQKRRKAVIANAVPEKYQSTRKEQTDPSKLRPPSYTDRILLHSLPDRQTRITVQAYDFCDTLRVSDHRAVSMTILLEVNAATEYFGEGESTTAHEKRKAAIAAARVASHPRTQRKSLVAKTRESITNLSSAITGIVNSRSSGSLHGAEEQEDDTHDPVVIPKEPKFELYELTVTELSVTLLDIQIHDDEDDGKDDEFSRDSDYAYSYDHIYGPKTGHESIQSAASSSTRASTLSVSDRAERAESMRSNRLVSGLYPAVSSSSGAGGTGREIELKSMDNNSRQGSSASSVDHHSPVDSRASTVITSPTHPKKKKSIWSKRFSATSSASSASSSPSPNKKSQRKRSIFSYFYGEDEDEEGTEGGEEGDYHTSSTAGNDLESGQEGVISGKRVTSSPEESEEDILREMTRESLAWQNTHSGSWRKKILEDERQRSLMRESEMHSNPAAQIKQVVKSNKKKKSTDTRISNVTIVFPLPAKDPLLIHRKMFDYAQVFDIVDEQVASPLAHTSTMVHHASGMVDGKGTLQHHRDLEQGLSKPKTPIVGTPAGSTEVVAGISRAELLRPMSIFPWSPKPSPSVENMTSLRYETTFQSADPNLPPFEVKGCASPELGAHALLKITNRLGYEFGSSVICVSHLIHRDPHILRSSIMKEIPLSAGGQKRGYISGKFSLRYIPSPLSIDQ